MIALFLMMLALPLPQVDASLQEIHGCGVTAVGFASPSHVWLADDCAGVLESNDSGRFWRRRSGYDLGFHTDDRRRISRFVWFTPLAGLALLTSWPEAFQTTDGGVTWTDVISPEQLPDLPVWSAHQGWPAPILSRGEVKIEEQLLGELAVSSARHLGWSSEHIFRSEDGGQSWFADGEAPREVRRMAVVEEDLVIAETSQGFFLSDEGGRGWYSSPDAAWSRYQLEKATGGPARARHPLACAIEAPDGRVDMSFGWNGCFGGKRDALVLEWRADGAARLATRAEESGDWKVTGAAFTAAQAHEALGRIVAATDRPEGRRACLSTLLVFARLSWSCEGVAHELSFDGNVCDSSVYQRAEGLRDLGEQLLNQAAAQ